MKRTRSTGISTLTATAIGLAVVLLCTLGFYLLAIIFSLGGSMLVPWAMVTLGLSPFAMTNHLRGKYHELLLEDFIEKLSKREEQRLKLLVEEMKKTVVRFFFFSAVLPLLLIICLFVAQSSPSLRIPAMSGAGATIGCCLVLTGYIYLSLEARVMSFREYVDSRSKSRKRKKAVLERLQQKHS